MEKDRRNRLFFLPTCSYLNEISEILPPSFNQSEDKTNTRKRIKSIESQRNKVRGLV